MNKLRNVAVAVMVTAGMVAAVPPLEAQATTTTVTINKIATPPRVAKGKKATIKPSVSAKGNVTVQSKTLTVAKGGKTIVKDKPSAALGVGTYNVATTVKYKTWAMKKTVTKSYKKVVGVKADVPTKVTCKISHLTADEPDGDGISGISLDATCTGKEFDGALAFKGLEGDAFDDPDYGSSWAAFSDPTILPFGGLVGETKVANGKSVPAKLAYSEDLMKTVVVTKTTTTKQWSKVLTKTSTQKNLTIKQK